MNFRPLHKFFGLLVLYIIIIFGIFLLQFRSESSFSQNFGQLRLSLSGSKNEDNQYTLNDLFTISFNGLKLYSNEVDKPYVTHGSETQPLVLDSWEANGSLACTLNFTDGTSICFDVSDNTKDATLSISAYFADKAKLGSVSIPYRTDGTLETVELKANRLLAQSKTKQYTLTGVEINTTMMSLIPNKTTAFFSEYTPKEKPSFDSITQLALATENSWNLTKKQLSSKLVSLYEDLTANSANEQETVAYLSEMLSRNNLKAALATADPLLPAAKRTYLSTPFFNNLVATSAGLIKNRSSMHTAINKAINSSSLNIFTTEGLGQYLLTESDDMISRVTAIPANNSGDKELTVMQASGILATYNRLQSKSMAMENLEPYLDSCIQLITESCHVSDDNLMFIYQNDTLLSTEDTVITAKALIDYGNNTSNSIYESAGYLLMNSVLLSMDNLSLQEIAQVHQIVNENSSCYPHYAVIGNNNVTPMWAWTVADTVSITSMTDDEITLTMHFPLENTHYVIVSGIPPFKGIEIYEMRFRTDPRFESYNSSGYVYNENSKMLFLKSRHKTETETIRFFYNEPEQPAPTSESETVSESTSVTEPKTESESTPITTPAPVTTATPVLVPTTSRNEPPYKR